MSRGSCEICRRWQDLDDNEPDIFVYVSAPNGPAPARTQFVNKSGLKISVVFAEAHHFSRRRRRRNSVWPRGGLELQFMEIAYAASLFNETQ
jgi:hypothetical protein